MQIVLQEIYLNWFRYTVSIFGIGLFLLASPGVLAASFDFDSSTAEFTAGCENTLNIMVDTAGKNSNAADIELYYNPNEIQILDSLPNLPDTQIKPGQAFETYFGNDVDAVSGRIRLTGASYTTELNSKKIFASVEFKSKLGVTSTSFKIKFDGLKATLDSNIAESSTSDDLLSSVTNGNYTFKTGDCVTAKTAPITPKPNTQNIAAADILPSPETSSVLKIPVTLTSRPIFSTLFLARTGGSLQEILLYNYWWGIPLLITLFLIISKRPSWLRDKNKTKLN